MSNRTLFLYISVSVWLLAGCSHSSRPKSEPDLRPASQKTQKLDEKQKKVDEFSQFESDPPSDKVATFKVTPTERSKKAYRLLEDRKHSEVTALLWPYIQQLNIDEFIFLCEAHKHNKEGLELVKSAQMLTAKYPKKEYGPYYHGLGLLMLKKDPEAIESLKEALVVNKQFEPAYLALINFYEKKKDKNNPHGNLYELRIIYNDMLMNLGEKSQYLTALCEVYYNDGLFDNSVQTCQKALIKNPKSDQARVYLGLSRLQQGENLEAETHLKRAAIEFKSSLLAQKTYAKYKEDSKDYQQSFIYYNNCNQINAGDIECMLGLAKSCFELQKFDCSIKYFSKSCSLDRSSSSQFRKYALQIRQLKNQAWSKKFAAAAERCTYSGF